MSNVCVCVCEKERQEVCVRQRRRVRDRDRNGCRTAVGLVRVVLAVIVPVTDVGRVGADARATLELTRTTLEGR